MVQQVDRPKWTTLRVEGLGPEFETWSFVFHVSCLGFRGSGFGPRVSGFGFRVSGFGFRVSGLGFRVSGAGFQILSFGFQIFGMRVPGGIERRGWGSTRELGENGEKVCSFHADHP